MAFCEGVVRVYFFNNVHFTLNDDREWYSLYIIIQFWYQMSAVWDANIVHFLISVYCWDDVPDVKLIRCVILQFFYFFFLSKKAWVGRHVGREKIMMSYLRMISYGLVKVISLVINMRILVYQIIAGF